MQALALHSSHTIAAQQKFTPKVRLEWPADHLQSFNIIQSILFAAGSLKLSLICFFIFFSLQKFHII